MKGVGISELGVTEFLTLARLGLYPRGLVVGAALFDAGQVSTALTADGRAQVAQSDAAILAASLRAARAQAVARMRGQAAAHGAEGVVGVRLEIEHHRWHGGRQVVKLLAVGTAIAFDHAHAPAAYASAPSLRLHDGGPFTSDLNGQDFVALLRAGYRPLALAVGSAIAVVNPQALRTYTLGFQNVEMSEVTQAFFDAREEAMETMEQGLLMEHKHGSPDHPVGIVGVRVTEKMHAMAAPVVEFLAVGTAITVARNDPRTEPTHPSPTLVVPLDR